MVFDLQHRGPIAALVYLPVVALKFARGQKSGGAMQEHGIVLRAKGVLADCYERIGYYETNIADAVQRTLDDRRPRTTIEII